MVEMGLLEYGCRAGAGKEACMPQTRGKGASEFATRITRSETWSCAAAESSRP